MILFSAIFVRRHSRRLLHTISAVLLLARSTVVAVVAGLEAKGVIVGERQSSNERGDARTIYRLRLRGP